ncbi:hypothetical protein FRC01_007067, partial [Tulasnella sp. 417]
MQEVYSSSGDDGLTTLSSLLPNPIHLGQIADFWKRYDSLADSNDRKMSKHLNDNLDVLLIFAGLFSAINTAFISFTMPALSPNPSTETNKLLRLMMSGAGNQTLALSDSQPFEPEPISIAINCLLYASLSCSLLAAMGVMMCKEWLHSFDRSGQTGSIEDQGRLRQRKLDGARRWELEAIIDFLPNIVLFSVTLFFIGLGVYLLTVNKTVAAIVGAFAGFGAVVAWISILASTFFPLCPYETATARVLRRAARILASFWTRVRRMKRKIAETRVVKGALQLLSVIYGLSKEAFRRVLSSSGSGETLLVRHRPHRQTTFDSVYPERDAEETEKQNEQQVTNARAALWLLEMAPSREDQLIGVQFLSTISKEACAAVIVKSERRQLIISLTLEAFDIWRNQPNEKTQETAEYFGRALGHVLPQTRGGTERWKELAALIQGPRLSLGRRFLRELDSFDHTPDFLDTVGEEYILQFAVLRTLIHTKDIPIETYRWTKLKFLIRNKDENSQLLGHWAMLMDVTDNDFPLALACGVQAMKSVERQAAPDSAAALVSDAVEIYNACIHKTRELVEESKLLPAFQELVADALTDMMAYFAQSVFLDPIERQMIDFFISALQLLQSVRDSGHKPCLDDSAFEGLWYTFDSVILAIDSSAEIERGYAEELVIKTLESISEWLPAKFGVFTPMTGLENHRPTMEYIISRVAEELQKSEGRFVHLMYRNRFRWFTQASGTLRAAWTDAGLSSQLIEALRRPDAWKGTVLLIRIFEDITEMSPEWCRRLVADGFLTSVADAIAHFDQTEDGNSLRRGYIQCRLTRALLSVWRHCSAISEINWPMEKMLSVITRASSATERLLRRDAAPSSGSEAQPFPSVVLDNNAVYDIRDGLISFFDWTKERLPASTVIGQDMGL